jgi:hypothetical protein
MSQQNANKPGTLGHKIGMGILLFVSAVIVLFGVGDIINGQDADPAIANAYIGINWEQVKAETPAHARLIDMHTRAGGGHLVTMGVMSTAIVLTGFRRGERWSWYLLWIWPLWTIFVFLLNFLSDRQPGFPPPPPMLSSPVFFAVLVLALGLSARRFFGQQMDGQRRQTSVVQP